MQNWLSMSYSLYQMTLKTYFHSTMSRLHWHTDVKMEATKKGPYKHRFCARVTSKSSFAIFQMKVWKDSEYLTQVFLCVLLDIQSRICLLCSTVYTLLQSITSFISLIVNFLSNKSLVNYLQMAVVHGNCWLITFIKGLGDTVMFSI